MSHFYGFIQGQAGDATRMGSKRSGYNAWAQSHQGRISIALRHNDYDAIERDEATISIEGGHSAYSVSRRYLPTFDLTAVPAALSCGDPKIDRIWARIEAEFRKLDAEAPKALARDKRRKRRAQLAAEREQKARDALVDGMSEAEFAAYMSVTEAHSNDYAVRLAHSDDTLRRDDRGHLFKRITDWDEPTGLRDVDLTALAATMPQDKLTRTLDASEVE